MPVKPGGPHEIELKRLLVGDGAADRLIAALGVPVRDEKRQTNHFFDTEDGRLDRARHVVRLRFEGARAILGAKGPSRRLGASTSSKLEAEADVSPVEAGDLLAGRLDPVSALRERAGDPAFAELWRGLDDARGGRPLRACGHFDNVRRTVPVVLPSGLGLDLEIDRARFPDGRVDDEVEVELPDDGVVDEVEAWLAATARAAGVTTAASTPKVARFFASRAPATR